ncbi:hypothetical protein CVT24_005579 [Panaeolus cyanescens]|uniref:Polynucleotide 5'-hydroxyl-kinase GRC3 n=1 Tax=Panaeolus cyanescens TaxID=181874 RepID=A0A409VQP9_9AGAR|nr:hypothetical protein CVT24_005579 [Panaeolus cyanescens]
MISAVAARKAALAAQQAASTSQVPADRDASTSTVEQPPSKPPSSVSKPPSTKRKPSTQKSRPEPKKLRKSKKRLPNDSMDVFREQTDVIDLGSGDSDEDVMDIGMSEDSDADFDSEQNIPSNRQSKRAWSPSMPLKDGSNSDSSLDDDDINGSEPFAGLDVTTLLPTSRNTRGPHIPQNEGVLSASTFEPSIDENLFFLTEEETQTLGYTGTSTLVGLNFHDTLCLLGTCTFVLVQGSLEVNGVCIRPSSQRHQMFAPRSSALPFFKCGSEKLPPFPLPASISPRLQELFGHRVVIMFQSLQTGVESLGKACRTFENVFELPRWPNDCGQKPFKIPGLSMVSKQTKDLQPFSPLASWSKALHDLAPSTSTHTGVYLIKGPKNTGKSTFSRNIVNHLLTQYRQVAYLECDIGQSEFTPGGMVALNIVSSPIFGPPFTHPTVPFSSHYVGHTTPRSSPSYYLDCILACIQKYRSEIQVCPDDMDDEMDSRISEFIPLVVNTMGWTKGLGADLTQKIQAMVEPTDIFDIQPTSHHATPHALPPVIGHQGQYTAYQNGSLIPDQGARTHILEQAPPTSLAGFTSADHRAISMLSYFFATFKPTKPGFTGTGDVGQWEVSGWDVSRPLCAIPPYSIDCSVAFDKVVLTGAGTEDVVASEIGRVLNGAIVGLVSCEAGALDIDDGLSDGQGNLSSGIPYSQQALPPLPQASNCIGIALVRGVSDPIVTENMTGTRAQPTTNLHLLTPLPPPLLSQANARILVKGELELPVWGMLDFRHDRDGDLGYVAGVERDKVPYLQWGKGPEGVIGGDKKRIRRNLMRKGQS